MNQTTEEEKRKEYLDGIKKTIIPGVFGIIGGILSFHLAGEAHARAGFGFTILVLIVFFQKYVFPLVNINTEELKVKDWIYIGFMTTTFWFVSWTILLN